MNYTPIHTNIYPSYNFMAAENAFLKQQIEYKDAVLCEQQEAINKLHSDITEVTQENALLKSQIDCFRDNANRWKIMRQILRGQGGERHLYDVEKVVDKEIERVGERKTVVERCDRRSTGIAPYPPPKPNR